MSRSLFRLILAASTLHLLCGTALHAEDLDVTYRNTASRILGAALTDDEGWAKLTHLTTQIGHRLSGSPQLEEAIDWAVAGMEEEGLERVVKQPVMVPHWVRGEEEAKLLSPVAKELSILGLGGSVATPPEGIEAPVVVVRNFEELEARGRATVEGSIVLYAPPWEGYGRTRRYRTAGASRAAALGAVAALVRSATGRSLYTPHTGALRYDETVPKIPAAAVTVEDAEWMRRLAEDGEPLRVRLRMEAQMLPDAPSANVMAEITGRELPQEVVVIGGHFDSWDVGQGAHDDGASCIAAWQALSLLKELGLRPRRTLRVVFWTNEENGLAGGRAYREWVGDEIQEHVAAIEMDGGAERPVGLGFGPGEGGFYEGTGGLQMAAETFQAAVDRLEQIGRLLDAIGAGRISRGGGGADIGPLMAAGVPGLALQTVGEHYFDWHHTEADTLDKVDPQDFRKAVAVFAVFGYVLADMPDRLVPVQP